MQSDPSVAPPPSADPLSADDVEAILRERGWITGALALETRQWMERAASLLGPQAADRQALAALLELVFRYDAREILRSTEAHTVLMRGRARQVIRALAHRVLEESEVDSDRLKEIITGLKEELGLSGRQLFFPLRLALAGRAGEGGLDRVILLLDAAAQLPFDPPVKSTRARMLEFCAALD